jgi:phosphinothricin acetyltransferase
MIRTVKPEDAAALCSIYNYYVRETAVTFEEIPVSIKEMERRVREISAVYPFFVMEKENKDISGYTYVNRWKDRSAFRYSAEATVYLKQGHEGNGLGSELFARLIESLKKTDIHAVVSGITIPNERSIALHKKFGFKNIALFNEIGFKLGKWLDVEYWELLC